MRLACMLVLVVVAAASGGTGAAKEGELVLAYASDPAGSLDLFVAAIGDASPRRVAGSRRDDFSPSWSPDGRRIAYRVNPLRSDVGDIWIVRADGTGARTSPAHRALRSGRLPSLRAGSASPTTRARPARAEMSGSCDPTGRDGET